MLNFFVIVFSFRLSEIALNLFIQKEKYMQFISKLFVIALILTSSVVSAQKKNILKLDITSPIMRTANVSFERILQDKISIDLNFGTVWNSGDKRISTNDPYASAPNDAFLPYVGYFVRTGIAVGFLF
jgi:hypothetical protein